MAIAGFGEIAERLRRSTVVVYAERAGRGQGASGGSGSGVIWTGDGRIITNAHVARGGRLSIQLWDGREFEARVAARDPRRDLALVRIDAANLPSAAAADSSQVRPGELAIAIGNPLGFVGALTTGVIHAVGPLRGIGSQTWVQADVRIAPGNSGGPLADARGRVMGINTMVAGRLALAVPSNTVGDFLAAGPSDAWLGVTIQPVRIPRSKSAGGEQGHSFGLLLMEVEPGSPAESASLLAGDILLGAEGIAFTSMGDLSQALEGNGPRVVRLEFLRGDYSRVRRVSVQLGGSAVRGSAAA